VLFARGSRAACLVFFGEAQGLAKLRDSRKEDALLQNDTRPGVSSKHRIEPYGKTVKVVLVGV
jgi:hypothetical protein